jgi:Choline/Carnitine o-acyltransferase
MLEVGQDSLSTKPEPPVGVLTAGHRDNWFEAYQTLSLDPQNKANLETIQRALFVVCLDDHSSSRNIDESHQQIFHNKDAHNRWFDKCIQVVVASSGRAGVNGEVQGPNSAHSRRCCCAGQDFRECARKVSLSNSANQQSILKMQPQVFRLQSN